MENAKPVVVLAYILIGVTDGQKQYFADAIDNNIPEDAVWVGLGDTDNNWIQIYPIRKDEPVLLGEFLKSGYYEVELDVRDVLPLWATTDIENCRWFAEIYE